MHKHLFYPSGSYCGCPCQSYHIVMVKISIIQACFIFITGLELWGRESLWKRRSPNLWIHLGLVTARPPNGLLISAGVFRCLLFSVFLNHFLLSLSTALASSPYTIPQPPWGDLESCSAESFNRWIRFQKWTAAQVSHRSASTILFWGSGLFWIWIVAGLGNPIWGKCHWGFWFWMGCFGQAF